MRKPAGRHPRPTDAIVLWGRHGIDFHGRRHCRLDRADILETPKTAQSNSKPPLYRDALVLVLQLFVRCIETRPRLQKWNRRVSFR